MTPKHQPADVRQAQILEAALAVCAERGYYATRIDDIAERAGLSKGAVYHHFPSKAEIFAAAGEQMMVGFADELRGAIDAGASVADTLRATSAGLTEMLAEDNVAAAMLDLYMVAIRDDEFLARFERVYRELIETCAALFRRGVETGELAPVDPTLAASTFLMSVDGLFLGYLLLDRGRDQELMLHRLELLVDMVLAGLLAPEGGTQ